MHELIRRRRRAKFIGRHDELAAFRENFDLPPEDDRHRFLFHVHGPAGVGKTFLVREMEQMARDRGALTAYLDESVGDVPEALARISAESARQGHPLKTLDKRLAAYRQKRHEAESVSLREAAVDGSPAAPAPRPSAGSMAVARAGLTGLGMVPVVGAFAGALDPAELAQGTDRLRATLGARFTSQDDVQLVLAPDRALTPVLVGELTGLDAPWIVLFFDTYERTGPFLDGWLRDVMTTDRYGALPAHVVVVLSGQRPFDAVRWGGWADFVADLPLTPFSESEARGLLAAKGVTDETVVAEVLRLSGGLPVLLSMLAENQPESADDVGDPSSTAVERFLKWEPDPVRRAAALAGALPRRLDEDVFRAAVDEPAAGLYSWLCRLPFVSPRGSRIQYHDVVRGPMLRLMRHTSRRDLAARHARLAAAFAAWRTEAAEGIEPVDLWEHEDWRAYRLEETYHLLCARPAAELPGALRETVEACEEGPVAGRQWARMLADAGEDADDDELRTWGRLLARVLREEAGREDAGEDSGREDDARAAGAPHQDAAGAGEAPEGVLAAFGLLLSRPGLDAAGRALAHAARGRELRESGDLTGALADYDRAVALDPRLVRGWHGRGLAHRQSQAYEAAVRDFDRCDELAPDTAWIIEERGETHRMAGDDAQAVADFDRAITLDPTRPGAFASRGVCQGRLGRHEEALADLDRALAIDGDYLWALVRRARLHGDRGRWDAAFADLDRAVRLAPDSAWIASERGEVYRSAFRNHEAVAEFTRALDLRPASFTAMASRAAALRGLGRHRAALADLDRAIELHPDYPWALLERARVRRCLGDRPGAFRDLDLAVAIRPSAYGPLIERAIAHREAGRNAAAMADLDRVLESAPDHTWALAERGATHAAEGDHHKALQDVDHALEAQADSLVAHLERTRVLLRMGRTAQVTAELDWLIDSGADPARIGWTAAWALLLDHRPDDALRQLRHHHTLVTDLWPAVAHHRAGQWDLARRCAQRASFEHPLPSAHLQALVLSESEGLARAAAQWRRVRDMATHAGRDVGRRPAAWAVVGYALGDWARADTALGVGVGEVQDWGALHEWYAELHTLLRSPGADRLRLSPRLAHVVAARDAVQTRYAHDLPD